MSGDTSENGLAFAGTSVTVRRVSDYPVVDYGAVEGYGPIFNAGAIFHDGKFHLFARGVHDRYRRNTGSGARFLDYISDVLVLTSDDGRTYEFQQVLARSAQDGIYSYEDARVQRVRSGGAERFMMTYTNLPAPETKRFWRIGLHELDVRGRPLLARRVVGKGDRPRGRAEQGCGDLQPPRWSRGADPPHLPQHAARRVRVARGAVRSASRVLGRAHGDARAAHDHPAGRHLARRRRRRADRRDTGRPAAALPRAGGERALRDDGRAARRRARAG